MCSPFRTALAALGALSCACTIATVDRRPRVYSPPPPPEPPPPVVYEPPPPSPPPVVYQNRTLYRYFGPHHIPDFTGGGWCYLEDVHDHEYAPDNPSWYRVERGVYFYSAPIAVTYYDVHPDDHGGWCYLHGPHRHGYHPPRAAHTSFFYDRDHRHYVYRPHDRSPISPGNRQRHHPGDDRDVRPVPHASVPVSPGSRTSSPVHRAEPVFTHAPPQGSPRVNPNVPGVANPRHPSMPPSGSQPPPSRVHDAALQRPPQRQGPGSQPSALSPNPPPGRVAPAVSPLRPAQPGRVHAAGGKEEEQTKKKEPPHAR